MKTGHVHVRVVSRFERLDAADEPVHLRVDHEHADGGHQRAERADDGRDGRENIEHEPSISRAVPPRSGAIGRLWSTLRQALDPRSWPRRREDGLYGPSPSGRPEPFGSPENGRTAHLERPNRADDHKRETRRKILAGAAALKEAATDPAAKAHLWALLDELLDENRDRELFDLEPHEERENRRRRQPSLPWEGGCGEQRRRG